MSVLAHTKVGWKIRQAKAKMCRNRWTNMTDR